MAITANDRGSGANNSSEATAITTSGGSAIAAGSTGILCIAADNVGSANFPASATDSAGNTWNRQVRDQR